MSKLRPPKPDLAQDMDATSTIVNLQKWLKSQKVVSELDFPGEDLPDVMRYGILFLNCLRTSQRYPKKLTVGEESILNVVAELHAKKIALESGINISSNEPAAPSKSQKQKQSDVKENVFRGKQKVPVVPKRTRAPLSEAMENLKIQENKGCSCKGECKTKVCGCRKKDWQCGSTCKCGEKCVNKQSEEAKQEPRKEKAQVKENTEEESEDEYNSSGSSIEDDSKTASDEDLGKEIIDWERHQTSLVPCNKCRRKFFPSRVEKHVQVCKEA